MARLFGRDGPPNSAVWEDASVRSGWVQGVHNMMHHQPALHLLCSGGEYFEDWELPKSSVSLPFQSVAQISNERDRCSHLFKTKISHLSKTLKSLKDGGVFVKLVILPPPPSPNTEGGALFRGERGISYETHDKNSLLKAFFILTCNSY